MTAGVFGVAAMTEQDTGVVRKQTDWLNRPSASRLTSQNQLILSTIETPSPRYHTIETVSVPRTRNTENVKTNL